MKIFGSLAGLTLAIQDFSVTKEATFEISQSDSPIGSITIGLFGNAVPKTVENFCELAKGHDFGNGKNEGYEGYVFNVKIEKSKNTLSDPFFIVLSRTL